MLAVRFDSAEPARQLACDEAIFRRAEAGRMGECVRLYEIARPAVVLGVSGRWRREVHAGACRRAGVPVARRFSGGGAVLLGAGCLSYSLILDTGARRELRSVRSSYRRLLGRLAAALRARGVRCELAGLCDLTSAGRKVGGSAQKRGRRTALHHGTLLYNFSVEQMGRYLREPESCPEYRAGRPHADFVANLPLSGAEVAAAVGDAFGVDPATPARDVTRDLADEVAGLVRQKYACERWSLRR